MLHDAGEKLTEMKEYFDTCALQDLLSEGEDSQLLRLLRVGSQVTGDNLLQWMVNNYKLVSCPALVSLLKVTTVLQELDNLPVILQLQSQLWPDF